jgi:23S rRNA (pseudouridine1915-N3)-methyltransferase
MIKIIFVGKSKEPWLKEQVAEYVKRISRFAKVQLIEVKDEKILGKDYDKIKNEEGKRILALIKDDFLIALDANGKSFESEEFAKAVSDVSKEKNTLTFVIGGALGLSDEVIKRADLKLSLSRMTFTNQLVRILLVEQIYRAFTITKGMDYHK